MARASLVAFGVGAKGHIGGGGKERSSCRRRPEELAASSWPRANPRPPRRAAGFARGAPGYPRTPHVAWGLGCRTANLSQVSFVRRERRRCNGGVRASHLDRPLLSATDTPPCASPPHRGAAGTGRRRRNPKQPFQKTPFAALAPPAARDCFAPPPAPPLAQSLRAAPACSPACPAAAAPSPAPAVSPPPPALPHPQHTLALTFPVSLFCAPPLRARAAPPLMAQRHDRAVASSRRL